MILKKENILPWVLVMLWMILIFYMSHQPAVVSDGLSTGITQKLMAFIEEVFSNSELNIDRINHYVIAAVSVTNLSTYLVLAYGIDLRYSVKGLI
ncbi:MAG: VanZ family protein [Proteocatella sp.]